MTLTVDHDLTFTHSEASTIVKEYVCAVCHSGLHIQTIPNHERVFILCPAHGNVCVCKRVMTSTVNIRVSSAKRDYYSALAAHPNLYGEIWKRGIPREDAEHITHKSVCGLCGSQLHVYLTGDPTRATVKCGVCHSNVGLSGYGFASKNTYIHIAPLKVREYNKKRATDIQTMPAGEITYNFDKIGSVGLDIPADADAEESTLKVFGRTVEISERIKHTCGKTPSRIGIQMLYPSLKDTFSQSLECYNRGALFAKAYLSEDGYQWDYYRDPYTQEIEIRGGAARTIAGFRMMQKGVNVQDVLYTSAKGQPYTLQNTGRLRFIIPSLAKADGSHVPGFFEALLTSNLDGIQAALTHARDVAFDNGLTLSEIPMTLFVQDGKPKVQLDLSK